MAAPKLRFKEFDADWISNKIIDLADYVDYRGKTPKKVESGILLVTAKNIKQGYLDYSVSQEFIEPSDFDEVMRRGKVELNDVLITTEAPLGNVASVDRTDIALAQRVIKYRGKIDLLDNLFLKQKFLSESFQEILKSKATGGTVQGIKGSVLHQIPLIVPSKQEQTKIASFLSAVDEKISQLTQKHALLSQYKQGMMQKLFSQQIRFKVDDGSEFGEWEEKILSELFDYANGKSFEAEVVENGKFKLITLNSIDIKANLKKVHKTISNSDNSLIKNDLIMILSDVAHGNFLGLTAIIPDNSYVLNQRVGRLRSRSEINIVFIRFYINFNQKYFKLNGQGSSQLNLSKADILNFPVSLPCIEEQTKIANFLSAIDQKIEVVAQQIEQAKTWKKGLLQQMFV
jgi:type I restriction enzyme S subunit